MLAIIKSSLFAIYIYMCKQYFIILMQFFHLFAIFFSLSLIASCNELLLCKFERKKGEYFTACLQKCMVWQCQKSSFCNKVKMFLNSSIEMQKKTSCENFCGSSKLEKWSSTHNTLRINSFLLNMPAKYFLSSFFFIKNTRVFYSYDNYPKCLPSLASHFHPISKNFKYFISFRS